MEKLLPIISLLIASFSLEAQTSISGVINSYTEVSAISGTTLTVGNSTDFNDGDLVLIIQMQGAQIDETNSTGFGDVISLNNCGNYEISTICSVLSGTQIELNDITRTYSTSGHVQLVRVPVYQSAIITAPLTASPWNGTIGGVLALECRGNLIMDDNIDLQGAGFRGGEVTTSSYSCQWFINVSDFFYDIQTGQGAKKGEGIAGYITSKTGGKGAQANGGGGSNDHNGGGAGGANAGAGGQGGERIASSAFTCDCAHPGIGGKANVYNNSANKIFPGGGGGAGHENNSGLGRPGSNGGGIVIIKAESLTGNGQTINASGAPVSQGANDGAGGGGAGGTVLLNVQNYSGTLNVNVSGANGGNVDNIGPSNCNGPGGGGGGGVLWVSQSNVPGNIVFNSNGGANGTTLSASQTNCSIGASNGATNGNPGSSITDLNLIQNQCNFQTNFQNLTICDTDSLFVGGAWQSSSGTYNDTIQVGCCDSVVVTDLTVTSGIVFNLPPVVACDSAEITGNWYYSSQNVNDVFMSTGGCDSITVTQLTINTSTTSTISETTLDSYTAPSGAVYTESGIYLDTIANAEGCDSIITINLTVEHTGIQSLDTGRISLIPNPATDHVNLIGLESLTNIRCSVFASDGRMVHVGKQATDQLDISKLETGNYFIKVQSDQGTAILRFLKE